MAKTALITGSSRGIGRATALKLAEEGYDIIVHYKKNAEMAEEVLDQIKKLGVSGMMVNADMENPSEIRSMFHKIKEEYGYLDVLVINAAATAFRHLIEQKEHNIDRTFGLTVKGSMIAIQEAVPLMIGRLGKIVTVSGIDSIRFLPQHGMLGAAKAALESLTRYWACELADKGITVNSVNPGFLDTDSSRTYAGKRWERWEKHWIATTPKKRLGTPEEIAGVISFLCSPEADFICGQTIVADGGLSLTTPFIED